MLFLAATSIAEAADRYYKHKKRSTTEKVVTAVAVGAIAGLAIYAATKDRGHDRYYSQRHYRGPRRHHPGPRSYVAVGFGFDSYNVGSPHYRKYRHNRPGGYWADVRGMRFYRTPYRYNPRYDRAFNAGWERGYWAGYLQGLNDARYRSPYYDRFQWNQRNLWGYAPGYGHHNSYERAFHRAFSIGYRHGFYGRGYGHEGFGFGVSFSYGR
jgi:hypothetical protein